MKKHTMHLTANLMGAMSCLLLVFLLTTAFNGGKKAGNFSGAVTKAGKAAESRCFTVLPFPEQQKQEVLEGYKCIDVLNGGFIILAHCDPGFYQCQWRYCNDWYPECQKVEYTETIAQTTEK